MRFHVVKRDNCPLWKKLCLYVLAVAAALGLGALVLLALAPPALTLLGPGATGPHAAGPDATALTPLFPTPPAREGIVLVLSTSSAAGRRAAARTHSPVRSKSGT